MDSEEVLESALGTLRVNDEWNARDSSPQEIFAAAAASLAAYSHPTELEIRSSKRAIIVPSETFQRRVQTGRILSAGFLPGFDASISFVETRYFVAAFVKVRDFVLVAYRGTSDGYDLFLDLQFGKCRLPARSGLSFKVHSGFATALLEGLPYVEKHLSSLEPYRHLVGSGHSLGGAICILHNAISNSYANELTNPLPMFAATSNLHPMRCCITFGSPKVGNLDFAAFCQWGVNVRRPADPIPMLPFALAGYTEQPLALLLADEHREDTRWPLLIRSKARLLQCSSHSIEGYVRLAGAAAGVVIS